MASASPAQAQQPRQTDVRRRTVLPSTLNNLRNTAASGLDLTSDEYLDKQEEELNRVVDQNVEQLVEGMKDLVALARVSPTSRGQLEGALDWSVRSYRGFEEASVPSA